MNNNTLDLNELTENILTEKLDDGDLVTDSILIGYVVNPNDHESNGVPFLTNDAISVERALYMLERAKQRLLTPCDCECECDEEEGECDGPGFA